MIRTRLSFAFALLALIAVLQCAFVLWSTREAGRAAEQSMVSTNLLNHYLELAANKQRLKVWLAETSVSSGAPSDTRDDLLSKMRQTLIDLSASAERKIALGADGAELDSKIAVDLNANFAVLESALKNPASTTLRAALVNGWAATIDAFEYYEGGDMRVVLQDAILRQREAAGRAEGELAAALGATRQTSIGLTILALLLGFLAVMYFVREMHRPFADVIETTDAIAADQYKSLPNTLRGRGDEFGRIGQHLDDMASKLATARRENEDVRAGLDAAVAARTEALTRSHDALLQLDARRRRFFADVSHELRTPVTVIRGEAEVALRQAAHAGTRLQQTQQEATYRAALVKVVEAAEGLGNRVQELVSLARTDAENQMLVRSQLPLTSVVRQAISSMRAIAINRRIHISQSISAAEDDVIVAADRDKLMQVLVIVLDNAIRYSQTETTVMVEIRMEQHQVRITVTDEGIGINDDEREQIFERHYRGRKACRMRPEGSGLGLSIARDIILQHQGTISVVPAVSGGTDVTITLPRVDKANALADAKYLVI